jgi:hypothetical protein
MDAVKRNSDQLNDYKEKANLYEMNAQNYKEEVENLEKEKEDYILEQNELQVQLYNQRSKVSELELHKAEIEKHFKSQLNEMQEKLKSNKLVIMEKDSKVLPKTISQHRLFLSDILIHSSTSFCSDSKAQ